MDLTVLERRLDDFDPAVRREALAALAATSGAFPTPGALFNLHCHSFFSYNGYGYSPSHLVWLARRQGFSHVGLVDFDVLDGVDEFHAAGRLLQVRTLAGLETRVFVPGLAADEINSPGEPGIAYHLGTGFLSGAVPPAQRPFLADLRERAQRRNQEIVAAVNVHLDPVVLNYEREVLPLTPAGVATERHLCAAYQAAAEQILPDRATRAAFWTAKLGTDGGPLLDDPVRLQAQIRAKTMKRGGPGYCQPGAGSFPELRAMNAFVRSCGGLPTLAWLDGCSAGEADPDRLLDLHLAAGVESVAIIPDRNWNFADAAVRAAKTAALHRMVAACEARGLPIQVGTEMNAPGQRLVDDFDALELAPVLASFRRGADVLFGHAVEALRGRGYCSDWSRGAFATRSARNDHYAAVGRDHAVLPVAAGTR